MVALGGPSYAEDLIALNTVYAHRGGQSLPRDFIFYVDKT